MQVEVEPIIDPTVRLLCSRPYQGHPCGCPNFGHKPGCPPSAPLINTTLDLSQPVYAICNVFPLGEHVARMRQKHPKWSNRQCRCCLYWQRKARKQLRELIEAFVLSGKTTFRIINCPEAQGVNVTRTLRKADIDLEWPPIDFAYQVVLAGKPVG